MILFLTTFEFVCIEILPLTIFTCDRVIGLFTATLDVADTGDVVEGTVTNTGDVVEGTVTVTDTGDVVEGTGIDTGDVVDGYN